jgi:hypothetical protein
LIGNHEAMNLYGDFRYVTAGDFAAFRGGDSERVRAMRYEQHVEDLRKQGAPEPLDAYVRKWMALHPPGFFERLASFAPGGRYGGWIASHNNLIRINDIVFVHAGIAPKFASVTISEWNERVRDELRDFEKLKGGIVMDPEGPLWYRGFAQRSDESQGAQLGGVLERLGAKYMVAGHTPTSGGAVTPRFNGRYIMIDVGLSQTYGSNRACLLVESGKRYAVHRGRKVPLPQENEADLLRYRNEIAEIDRAGR